jgi:hypothetical protein
MLLKEILQFYITPTNAEKISKRVMQHGLHLLQWGVAQQAKAFETST